MKSRGDQDKTSRRKLIDRLLPGSAYGPLVGLLATTYEFQPEFFETDFLPTLLGLGAWDDRNWTSRVAVEKALAELEAAAIFADARRYQGRPRSLRVDVFPVALSAGAALHAKVALLVHRDAVRLHIASANLTEQGYRRNREVVAPLVVTRAHPEHAGIVAAALTSMKSSLQPWWNESAERVVGMALDVLRRWPVIPDDDRVLWGSPGNAPMDSLLDTWPATDKVQRITIVSPFWSDERGDTGPLGTVTRRLREAGALSEDTEVRLLTDAKNVGAGKFLPVLPESFAHFDARTLGLNAVAVAVDPSVLPEEVDNYEGVILARPLHAKVILLEGRDTSVAYLGSANFSQRAWGFLPPGAPQNIEAGVVLRRTGKDRAGLAALIPKTIGAAVPLAGAAGGRLALTVDDEPDNPWPSFLREIRLETDAHNPERLVMEVRIEPTAVSGPWSVSFVGDEPESLLLAVAGDTSADRHLVELSPARLEHLLRDQEVRMKWWVAAGDRVVPVNVALGARDALPIVPGSAKPGESLLLAYYQGRITFEDLFPDPDAPGRGQAGSNVSAELSGVDTSRIQSYQVREFVEALKGIGDDLKQAAKGTPRAMKLALHGAVSPVSLARAVAIEVSAGRRSPTAAAFQLFEILCCLLEIRKAPTDDQYSSTWRAEVDGAIRIVEALLGQLRAATPALNGGAFTRYEKTLRAHHRASSEAR